MEATALSSTLTRRGATLMLLLVTLLWGGGFVTSPAQVRVIKQNPRSAVVEISIHEGKNREIRKMFEEDWHNIVYDRRYVAVLCGEMTQEGGTVHSWLKDNKAYITYSSPTDNGGKEAITHYRRVATNGRYTLAEMRLETGRKNQIRVHMKDLGYPVAGDDKYGNGLNPLHRLALHAFRLDPSESKTARIHTPLALLDDYIAANGLNTGKVMNSLRIAVVGRTVGPDMITLVMMLGKDETISRIRKAIDKLKTE